MTTLTFTATIAAPPGRVWDVMLDPDHYRTWTAAFCEGSHFEGSWTEGSRLRFLTPEGQGIAAEVTASRRGEVVALRHDAIIADGVEDPAAAVAQGWAGAREEYTFTAVDGGTRLDIRQDAAEEHAAAMEGLWTDALARLKALCEGGA